jgi:hypothetical protein
MSLKFDKTETSVANYPHGKNIAAYIELAINLTVANAVPACKQHSHLQVIGLVSTAFHFPFI